MISAQVFRNAVNENVLYPDNYTELNNDNHDNITQLKNDFEKWTVLFLNQFAGKELTTDSITLSHYYNGIYACLDIATKIIRLAPIGSITNFDIYAKHIVPLLRNAGYTCTIEHNVITIS